MRKPEQEAQIILNPYGLFPQEFGVLDEVNHPLYLEAHQAFPLTRLTDIRALGFLTPIGLEEFQLSTGYDHNRYEHSLLVARTLEHVMNRNNFSDLAIAHGVVAGLLHDIATPAGGDAVKAIDREALDEEDFWSEMVTDSTEQFFQKHNLSPSAIDDIIHNQGVIGQLLDVVDRIAYTTLDTYKIHGANALLSLQTIAGLSDSIRVNPSDHRVYFDDDYLLRTFLQLRAHNNVTLYMHPVNRAKDYLIGKIISQFYSRDGTKPLSPKVLRMLSDRTLFEILTQELGLPFTPEQTEFKFMNLYPMSQYSESEEDDHHNDPEVISVGRERLKGFNPATNLLVFDPSIRDLVPFEEYDPINASVVLMQSAMCAPHILTYSMLLGEDHVMNKVIREACIDCT